MHSTTQSPWLSHYYFIRLPVFWQVKHWSLKSIFNSLTILMVFESLLLTSYFSPISPRAGACQISFVVLSPWSITFTTLHSYPLITSLFPVSSTSLYDGFKKSISKWFSTSLAERLVLLSV